jgi:hypothetical protein
MFLFEFVCSRSNTPVPGGLQTRSSRPLFASKGLSKAPQRASSTSRVGLELLKLIFPNRVLKDLSHPLYPVAEFCSAPRATYSRWRRSVGALLNMLPKSSSVLHADSNNS